MLSQYTSYASISIYMKLGKVLTDLVSVLHDDFEWIQPINYEHVPFRCRKCHAHEHLFHDFPLNAHPKSTDNMGKSNAEGFTKVACRKKHNKKPPTTLENVIPSSDTPSSSNSFDILSNLDMCE